MVTNQILKVFVICLNLLDTTIWSMITGINSIGSLDLWNSFWLSLILLNFSVFHSFFIWRKTQKIKRFFFILNQFLILFSLVLFNLVFFILGQVFMMLSLLFFYRFFVLCIILNIAFSLEYFSFAFFKNSCILNQ